MTFRITLTTFDAAGRRHDFYFGFDEESYTQIVLAVGRMAANPDLAFDWSDASQVCRRAAQLLRE